jgi:hypothetical protein
MAEALAERLLDLHCRLLSLYVLQDADCLHWEDPHPFFEGERGSFVIQMWWLYMQGNGIFAIPTIFLLTKNLLQKVCGVQRHFLSDPYMTWSCFTPLVSSFSGVVTKPTAASFVRIAKLFHKIIIITKMIRKNLSDNIYQQSQLKDLLR